MRGGDIELGALFPGRLPTDKRFGSGDSRARDAAFISRPSALRENLHTAYQYKTAPIGLTSIADVSTPQSASAGYGRFSPFYWGWATNAASTCVWLYNVSRSIAVSAGYFFLNASLLNPAWVYLVLFLSLSVWDACLCPWRIAMYPFRMRCGLRMRSY